MKKQLLLICALSTTLFGLPSNPVYAETTLCKEQATSYYHRKGPRSSDIRREIKGDGRLLQAGQTLQDNYGNEIQSFSQNVIVYKGVGSVYSGWFEVAVVVDPSTCEIIDQILTYSE